MNRRRFFALPDAFELSRGSVMLGPEEARHLKYVLRLKQGAEVFVFDGRGREYRCIVAGFGRDSASLEIVEEIPAAKPESPLALTIAIALLKGEKFDLVVQKATELGVTKIVPVSSRFSDIKLRDEADTHKRVGRWQRIALEAAKQSGRAFIPEVMLPVTFEALVNQVQHSVKIMFSERSGEPLKQFTDNLQKPVNEMMALVGSEGGWADEEISDARHAGWLIVTLGGRTLRAETAAIATVTLLQHLYGDLK